MSDPRAPMLAQALAQPPKQPLTGAQPELGSGFGAAAKLDASHLPQMQEAATQALNSGDIEGYRMIRDQIESMLNQGAAKTGGAPGLMRPPQNPGNY